MRKNSFFFWIYLIVAICVFDYFIGGCFGTFYKRQKYGVVGKSNYIVYDITEPVIIFGSSKARVGYDPAVFKEKVKMETYNAGFDGKIIRYHLAMFQLMLMHHTPATIILDITDKDIWDFTDDDPGLKDLTSLNPYFGINPVVDSMLFEISKTERIKLISKCYRYNNQFTNLLVAGDDLINGYSSSTSKLTIKQRPQSDRIYDNLNTNNLSILEKFIMLCKERGVQIYIVISPVYVISDASVFAPVKNLAASYSIPCFDFYQDKDFTEHPELFADLTHLNGKGAQILSAKVVAAMDEGM